MYIYYCGVSAKLFILLALCAVSSAVSAQTIGNWNFNNTLTGTAATYNTVSAASLSSSVTSGGYYNGTMYYGAGWPSGSIDTNMYLEFSLTPNAGYTLNIASVELTMRRGTQNGQGAKNWALRSSVDGFASNLASGSLGPNFSTETITLNAQFNNLSTAITFRVYGYSNNAGATGQLSWDNITVKGLSVLPVNFISLAGKISGSKVLLAWNIDTNNQLNYFEIERSENGKDFIAVDKVYKQQTTNYSFTCKTALTEPFVWYRIKSIEVNGSIKYSDILKLHTQQNGSSAINKIVPAGGQITVQVNAAASGAAKIMLVGLDGKIMYQQTRTLSKGVQTIQLSRNNTPGIQVVTIVLNNQLMSRQFVN